MFAKIAISLLLCTATAAQAETRAVVFPFALTDDQATSADLGQSVATIVNLEIWRTMQAVNQHGDGAGDAKVLWDNKPLNSPSHYEVAKRATDIAVEGEIAVWGKVYQLQNQAVVTSFITLPKDPGEFMREKDQRNEKWPVALTFLADQVDALDVPTRAYEFQPFVLSSDFYSQYSQPNAVKVLSAPELGAGTIGTLGNNFKRIRSQGDFEEVAVDIESHLPLGQVIKVGAFMGWVHLPLMSESNIEVVRFSSGLLRYFRGDWVGAIDLFASIGHSEKYPISVQRDALLFLIRSKSESGADAGDEIQSVMRLDPYNLSVARYVMNYGLSRCLPSAYKTETLGAGPVASLVKSFFSKLDIGQSVRECLTRSHFVDAAKDVVFLGNSEDAWVQVAQGFERILEPK